jgi:ribose-phosphate pyrophosphokinase
MLIKKDEHFFFIFYSFLYVYLQNLKNKKNMIISKKIFFATSNYTYLLNSIMELLSSNSFKNIGAHIINGDIEVKKFPDGEIYHKLQKVSNNDVIIIGGTVSDSETLELYDMACHCSKDGANSITLVIPYFGYATMERAVKSGEIVKAKTRARLLSSIPATCRIKILFMDLHSEGTPHYLEGSIQPVHLYAKKLIIEMCQTISMDKSSDLFYKNKNFVLASTDAGRAKWVESLANEMGVECAIITKRRESGTNTSIVGINADVKGKKVVIYDDMIRTGGSLISAGKAYRDAGASNVYAVASHGVLPGESIFTLYESKVFDKVFVTNTHPRANSLKNGGLLKDFYKVFDISHIILDHLSEEYLILF